MYIYTLWLAPYSLDTLAQNETDTNHNPKPNIIVNGKGTQRFNNPALKHRARAKTLMQPLILQLVDIAKEHNNPIMEQRFWNTYHCQKRINYSDGKLHGIL